MDRPASLPLTAKAPASPTPAMSPLETDIMRCIVRSPERIGDIASIGAQRILSSPFALSLWTKIAQARPATILMTRSGSYGSGGVDIMRHRERTRTRNALKKCLEENFLKIHMQKHVAGLRQKEARGLTILS